MANFLGMGFNRRNLVSGFLIFFSCVSCVLAQFSASDSDELYNIRRNTDLIESDVDSILSALTGDSTLYSVQRDMYSFLRGNNGVGGIPNIISLLAALSGDADTANSRLSDIYTELGDQSSILTTIENLLNLRLTNIQGDIREGNSYLSLIKSGIDSDSQILLEFKTLTASQLQGVLDSLGVVNQNLGYLGIPLQSIDSKLVVSEDGIKVYSTKEDEISSSLHEIASSFTNFMNNAPLSYEPSFLTNWYATTTTFILLGQSIAPTVLNRYFNLLFGRDPTSAEAASFRKAFYLGGQQNQYYADFLSTINVDNVLPSFGGSSYLGLKKAYNSILTNQGFTQPAAESQISRMQDVARMRYYQYGTRPLLEFFEQATNDFPLSGSSAIVQTDVDGVSRSSFSPGFVQTVSSLSESFAPTVSSEVATVDTNEITDVRNDTIANTWDQARNTSADNYALTALASDVNDLVSSGASSVLGVFEEQGSQSLDFLFPVQIGSSVQADLNYQIPATAPLLRPYVLFFAGIVKCIIVVYFGLQIWENVVKDVWMGRRF